MLRTVIESWSSLIFKMGCIIKNYLPLNAEKICFDLVNGIVLSHLYKPLRKHYAV